MTRSFDYDVAVVGASIAATAREGEVMVSSTERDPARLRVAGDIGQALLGDAVDGELGIRLELR